MVGSERGIMLGRDVAVGLASLADPRWDYVAMGHIHKHQALNAAGSHPPIVYPVAAVAGGLGPSEAAEAEPIRVTMSPSWLS